ncbi:hypothetical protein CUMW_098850 [Citrus unshiu]|nr:hypothetical protein CUMW_098850 [Citrus unshiu]
MADHRHHRPQRISVPPRASNTNTIINTPSTRYPSFSYPPVTPTPATSGHRPKSNSNSKSSLQFLILILFSLRSLYSLLPFLRSSPSFSLFPFTFLVSLLSFLLSLAFSLFSFPSSKRLFNPKQHQNPLPIFPLNKSLLAKSFLLACVFLLRFQALRYCGTAAMILAEISGNVAGRFVAEGRKNGSFTDWSCYERVSMNWGAIRQLSQKQVRLISLFYTTVLLSVPALVSWIVFENYGDGDENSISFANLAWPLANTVVFGVLLSENYSDQKFVISADFQREFVVTLVCTIVLELFYYPELSLWGLLLCVLLLYFAVRELDPVYSNYHELGFESSESFSSLIMKPIRHILSERKSRKIALFLLINTGYMVVEFVAGFMSNSLGLISDACHMLFDCAALAIGLYASYISRLPANSQFNYGRGRFEVLSGYTNAVFLVLVGALIVLESFERILDPQEISTNSLLTVSIGGLLVNVIGLIFFHEEHHHAHGGVCSHSHSHSHSHPHHHHQHSHDHEGHGKRQECISISHESNEKSCSSHDHHHCTGHTAHHHGRRDHCDSTLKHEHTHGYDDQGLGDQHSHRDHTHKHNNHYHHHPANHNFHAREHDDHDHHHHADHHEPLKHDRRHIDHNMEGIFLHVLADTMGSVGVVISTLLIKYKGWLVADPACSIFISLLIVSSVIPLLRNSAEILLQRVSRAHELDLKETLNDVMKISGVHGIQNLHLWSFTSTDVVGTLNLHVSSEADMVSIKAQVSHMLSDAGIKDLTLQVECVRKIIEEKLAQLILPTAFGYRDVVTDTPFQQSNNFTGATSYLGSFRQPEIGIVMLMSHAIRSCICQS